MNDELQISPERLQELAVIASTLWASHANEQVANGDTRYWHPFEQYCHSHYFDEARKPDTERIWCHTRDAFRPLFERECFNALATGVYPALSKFRAGKLHAREFARQLQQIAEKELDTEKTVVYLDTHSSILRIMFNVPDSDRYGKGSRAQSVQLFNPKGSYYRNTNKLDSATNDVSVKIQDRAKAKLDSVIKEWKAYIVRLAEHKKAQEACKQRETARLKEAARLHQERRFAIQDGLCKALGCGLEAIPQWALSYGISVTIPVPEEPQAHAEAVARLVRAARSPES